jgi:hypothetical protein
MGDEFDHTSIEMALRRADTDEERRAQVRRCTRQHVYHVLNRVALRSSLWSKRRMPEGQPESYEARTSGFRFWWEPKHQCIGVQREPLPGNTRGPMAEFAEGRMRVFDLEEWMGYGGMIEEIADTGRISI